MEWENEKHYVDGYQSPIGPLKWMSRDEKDAIHALIDVKMQELEVSGLTREEILHNWVGEGMTLWDDMFYQFLKSNRLAWEMLIKPGQEFSVSSVIEMALR